MQIMKSLSSRDRSICGFGHKMSKVTPLLLLGAIWTSAAPVLSAQDSITQSNTDSVRSIPESTSVAPKTITEDYVISPDDDLEIFVLDVAELSRTYRVSPTGMISVPLLSEPISAAGKSPTQLSQVIADQLREAGMVSHPQVTVQVRGSRLHSIAIAGSVKKPQIYPIFGKTTLMDALSQAEGLADDAGNTAIISRGDISSKLLELETSGESATGEPKTNPRTVTVNLKKLMEEGDLTQNFDLYPGDRVTVQRAGIVYVEGAVNRAGGFVLKNDREQMTVLKALALAEYVKSTANTKHAVIIRGTPKGPGDDEVIPIELDKMLKRRAKDRVLLANDILLVPDSSSKRVIHRAGEAAAEAAVLMVYH